MMGVTCFWRFERDSTKGETMERHPFFLSSHLIIRLNVFLSIIIIIIIFFFYFSIRTHVYFPPPPSKSKTRNMTLLEQHAEQEKKRKKTQSDEAQPIWDRDLHMSVGGRLMDDKDRKAQLRSKIPRERQREGCACFVLELSGRRRSEGREGEMRGERGGGERKGRRSSFW